MTRIARAERLPGKGGCARDFLELDLVHEKLEEDFQRHQEALVTHRYSDARSWLKKFKDGLRIHMRHEEQLLLPLYESRCGRMAKIKGFKTNVFVLEHSKIMEWLSRIQTGTRGLRIGRAATPRAVISILDLECTFKHLIQHHNQREHNILYPALNRLTTKEERADLLRSCMLGSAVSRRV
ncbi:MAG: hemerythrin domain-containing protein [Planctomycetota bacterium]|nr:hemerythrin domain-containing protein [Planctomycetota bacterium]